MERSVTCTRRGQLKPISEGQESKLMRQHKGSECGSIGKRPLPTGHLPVDGIKNPQLGWNCEKNKTGNLNLILIVYGSHTSTGQYGRLSKRGVIAQEVDTCDLLKQLSGLADESARSDSDPKSCFESLVT